MSSSPLPGWRWLVIAALLAIGAVVAWKLFPIETWLETSVDWIESLGAWGPIVWFACFAILGTVSFPTTPLYLTTGVLFGVLGGALLAFSAGLTASLASFLIARHLARSTWQDRLDALPRFQELLAALEDESFKVVVLARVSPFIPAAVKNYGFGLTSIPFRRYCAATAIGQLPIAAAYTYLGWASGTAMLGGEKELSRTELSLLVAGGVASILLLVLVTWHARRVLQKRP